MNVRLISSDHLETVKYAALELDIIEKEWYYEPMNKGKTDGYIMHSDEFRSKIGSYVKVWDKNEQIFKIRFKDSSLFKEIRANLRIIARASSEDKLIFVNLINKMGGLMGMSGDSISDASALKDAPVGFCMGQGCDVTKDASDMIV